MRLRFERIVPALLREVPIKSAFDETPSGPDYFLAKALR